MARGRALLRNYTATPEPTEPRPVKLPQMRGNQTMSAPARPDLWKVDPGPPPSAETSPSEVRPPAPVPLQLMGARPSRLQGRRTQSATLVPSAFDAGTIGTLVDDADHDWFGTTDPVQEDDTMDVVVDELDEVTELPRVLDAAVELTVFFAGLATGLAVQGAIAWLAWTTLVG